MGSGRFAERVLARATFCFASRDLFRGRRPRPVRTRMWGTGESSVAPILDAGSAASVADATTDGMMAARADAGASQVDRALMSLTIRA